MIEIITAVSALCIIVLFEYWSFRKTTIYFNAFLILLYTFSFIVVVNKFFFFSTIYGFLRVLPNLLKKINSKTDILFLITLLSFLLSVLISNSLYPDFRINIYSFLPIFAWMLFIYLTITTSIDLLKLIGFFSYLILFQVGFLGLLSYNIYRFEFIEIQAYIYSSQGNESFSGATSFAYDLNRLSSLFFNSAADSSFVLMLAFAFFLFRYYTTNKKIHLLYTLIIAISITFTWTRSAFILTMVLFLLITLRFFNKNYKFNKILFLTSIITTMLFGLGNIIENRFVEESRLIEDGNLIVRIEQYISYATGVLNNGNIFSGLNKDINELAYLFNLKNRISSESFYIQNIILFGFIPAIFLICLTLLLIYQSLNGLRTNNLGNNKIGLDLHSVMCYMSISGFIFAGTTLFTFRTNHLIWFLLTLLLISIKVKINEIYS